MSNITKETINQCSIRLGSFNSATVDTLVYFFHHQDGCVQLTSATNNLKEKFENLLTVQENDDDKDTPWTRIEVAVMLHFKAKYLEQNVTSANEPIQLKTKRKLSLGDELDLAYAFLLAQVNDRLSLNTHIKDLMFMMQLQGDAYDLYDVYTKSSQDFSNFFCSILQCDYLSKKFVLADSIIRNFQSFIKRYEDFLITYDKFYKPAPENRNECTLLDEMMNTVDIQEDPSLGITIFPVISEKPRHPTFAPDVQPPNISKPLPTVQQPRPAPPSSSVASAASNMPQKGLCVIINIQSFMNSPEITAKYRTGSDVDVENIRVIFKNSGFKVIKCTHDFKKADVDKALEQINDKDKYGQCDCLVMFIMSHGFLNSLLTMDQKIINIRDIIKQYSDTSSTTIWAGKPRLFFIQACRSLSPWPEYLRRSSGQEVKQSDLSPSTLIAYSCSPAQASKRHTREGSIFVQMLCVFLLYYGHSHQIQEILHETARFVSQRDVKTQERLQKAIERGEIVAQLGESVFIQRPEFLEANFNKSFRVTKTCLNESFSTWDIEDRMRFEYAKATWKEIKASFSAQYKI